jgi:hypothetical protein
VDAPPAVKGEHVVLPAAPVTSRRRPNRPAVSNAMPFGVSPPGRSAKRRAWPYWSTTSTPGCEPSARA